MRQEHLDGDGAIESGITGLIDLAHAARAEGPLDLVGAAWCLERGTSTI